MTRQQLMDALGTTGVVPPADAGQMIEVGFARCNGGILRITVDRSYAPDKAGYAVVEYADDADIRPGSYQPQVEAPSVSAWRKIDARTASRMMRD